MSNRTQVEKSLSSIAALLGETTDGVAAVECLRELAEDSIKRGISIKVERGFGSGSDVVDESTAAVCYCLDRVAIAILAAKQSEYGRGWRDATAAAPDDGDPDEDDDCPRDGEAESALESVYGPDNGEG